MCVSKVLGLWTEVQRSSSDKPASDASVHALPLEVRWRCCVASCVPSAV